MEGIKKVDSRQAGGSLSGRFAALPSKLIRGSSP